MSEFTLDQIVSQETRANGYSVVTLDDGRRYVVAPSGETALVNDPAPEPTSEEPQNDDSSPKNPREDGSYGYPVEEPTPGAFGPGEVFNPAVFDERAQAAGVTDETALEAVEEDNEDQ